MKYLILILGCGAAGLLTGLVLRSPAAHDPRVNPAPQPASSQPVAEPFSATRTSAVSDLIQSLSNVPAGASAELDSMLLDGIERLSSKEIGSLLVSLTGHSEPRLQNLRSAVLGYWASRDLVAARDWSLKQAGIQAVTDAYAVSETWYRQDARAFADWLSSLSPAELGKIGEKFLSRFIDLAGSEHADRLLPLIDSLPDASDRERAHAALFKGWAKRNPASAARRVLQLPSSSARAEAIESVAAAWSERDPAAAWSWISSLPDAVVAQKAQRAFMEGLSKSDPAAAADRVAELPLTKESGTLLNTIGYQWAQKDPEAALRWARKIDETLRGRVFARIQDGAITADFEVATKFLIDHADETGLSSLALAMMMPRAERRYGKDLTPFLLRFPEKHRAEAVLAAADFMQKHQPDFVENWALREPEGPTRIRLLASVAGSRHERDPEAALKWAEALPEGRSKRRVVNVIVEQVYQRNPERSVEVLRSLTPREALEPALRSHLRTWMLDAPKTARKWIEQTASLSSAQKQDLLGDEQ